MMFWFSIVFAWSVPAQYPAIEKWNATTQRLEFYLNRKIPYAVKKRLIDLEYI